MDRRFPEQSAERRGARFRRIFVMGLLIVIVMVGSVAGTVLVLFYTGHLRGTSATTSTPPPSPIVATSVPGQTPTSGAVVQGSLYTAEVGSLTRIDLRTGKVIWTMNVASPTAPLVMGETLFFDNQDSSNYFLESASVEGGRQLWRNAQYPNGFLLGANNTLYDSTCNIYATSDPCHLYGINASTGARLWSYDLPQGNAWIALQNGVLYGVSYTSYFALNASSGVPLWQKNLLRYTDQEANMTPVVSENVLSFASCNVTKQSSGFPGCYVYAFNADSGAELWHMATSNAIQVSPTIMDGVIYAAAVDGTVYAVSEQSGAKLWTVSAGGTVGQLLDSAGVVYVEIRNADGQTSHMVALDAATHGFLWGQSGSSVAFEIRKQPTTIKGIGTMMPLVQHLPGSVFSGGPADNPFVLDGGLVYLHSGSNVVDALRASDGSQVVEYSVPGVDAIYGFTVSG